jgi:CheY-like chemotaxis protein
MRMVLVVDDDSDLRSSLTDCLASAGYSVADAADIVEASRKLRSLKPDLVLLDQRVPSFDSGNEFLRSKAADAEVASIPVILMSGYLHLPAVDGVVGMLAKPFTLDELLDTVGKFAGPPHEPAAVA